MSVEDIATRYLTGIKNSSNSNILAKCPFHRRPDGSMERTPSFSMSVDTGLWYCFSCKEGGSLKKFLYKVGLDSYTISEKYTTLIESLKTQGEVSKKSKYFYSTPKQEELSEAILGSLSLCPVSLIEEGFEEETLQHFEVGFDTKHYRITYPLRDIDGELIGISGRTVVNANPRYKVYSYEYTSFGLPRRSPPKKSLILWNMHNVYPSIFLSNETSDILLVEGFKGCMWAWQSGIRNVVALLGSALSEYQEWLLLRTGSKLYLMLDNDAAGVIATKVIGERLSKKTDVKIIEYEEAQPDKCKDILSLKNSAKNYFQWNIGNKYGIR